MRTIHNIAALLELLLLHYQLGTHYKGSGCIKTKEQRRKGIMKLRLMGAAACALSLLSTASIAVPILASPDYWQAPGGNNSSTSGSGASFAETVITYSNFDSAAYADLYYAFGDAGPIGVWDTFLTDGPSIYAGNSTEAKNPLSYDSVLSNFGSGLVVWNGTTTIVSSSQVLNTRWTMEITDTSNNPLGLTSAASLGLDPALGGVLNVAGDFKVTLNALIQNPDALFNYNNGSGFVDCATGDWCHANKVWDELGVGFTDSSDTLYTSYDNAFYYNPVPIPAAVWLFGSGLIGLVGIARRKKA
jgi:hypothetical protein